MRSWTARGGRSSPASSASAWSAARRRLPSDRAFYMDFHPYRDAAGRLFVSTAIYSGFNCVEPVFQGFDEPIAGEWVAAVTTCSRAPRSCSRTASRRCPSAPTWATRSTPLPTMRRGQPGPPCGLALAPASPTAGARVSRGSRRAPAPISSSRRLRPTTRRACSSASRRRSIRITVRFARCRGRSSLGEGSRLDGATGTFDAATASVTMGNKTLDAEIRKAMLRTDTFPGARFVLDPVEAARLQLCSRRPGPVHGDGSPRVAGRVHSSIRQGAGGSRLGRGRDAAPRRAREVSFAHRLDARAEGPRRSGSRERHAGIRRAIRLEAGAGCQSDSFAVIAMPTSFTGGSTCRRRRRVHRCRSSTDRASRFP